MLMEPLSIAMRRRRSKRSLLRGASEGGGAEFDVRSCLTWEPLTAAAAVDLNVPGFPSLLRTVLVETSLPEQQAK